MQIFGFILIILFLLFSFFIVCLPFILGIIISVIIIYFVRKKYLEKENEIKKIVITISLCISLLLIPLWYNFISARPNKVYVKMKEISDSQSLIGLTKEQVIELLGEPYGDKDLDTYYYEAGKITNYITGGTNEFYTLQIVFDENGKVILTSMELVV